MPTTYQSDNLFAKLLRNEIPSIRVYEDDTVVAFMDVMPQGIGHTLVIPRTGSRNILDCDPQTLQNVILAVQKVAQAVKKAFNAEGVTIMQFNEPAGGQTIFHLHFHIIPRFEGVPLNAHITTMADPQILEDEAKKIRAAF